MAQSVLPKVLLIAMVVLGLASPAHAQATGALAGVATDDSGAVMPGVTVTVTNTATNQVRTVVTGSDGYYYVPLLPPGRYDVKATLAGFKTVIREGITVEVGIDLAGRPEAGRRPRRGERHRLDGRPAGRNLAAPRWAW